MTLKYCLKSAPAFPTESVNVLFLSCLSRFIYVGIIKSPPGLQTRFNSASAFSGSSRRCITLPAITLSKLSSGYLSDMIFAYSKVILVYDEQFFSARLIIFGAKSVATSVLHLSAITALSIPVPAAHSSTLSFDSMYLPTILFSSLCVLLFITLTNMS